MALKSESAPVTETDLQAEDGIDGSLEGSLKLAHALQLAAGTGNLEKCRDLIEKGALPWQQDPLTGWSALHNAAGVFALVCVRLSASSRLTCIFQTMVVSISSSTC